jgi:glycosyltransferase involved in cell wall biosynthesis
VERTFQSCLCVDNAEYAPVPGQEKRYDIMFAGQLIPRKMPLFFLEVARELSRRLARCRALIIGAGPLHQEIKRCLQSGPQGLEVTMPGFVQPEGIPSYYRQSRLFLFPSLEDAWGVVANEAAAAGLPIIATQEAGAAGELVQHGVNGFVLAPEKEAWASAAQQLLENPTHYERMANSSLKIVSSFTRANAAKGMHDAALCAVAGQSGSLRSQ